MAVRHAEWIADHLGDPGSAPLESSDIAALEPLLREHHVSAGSTVFRAGDAPTRIGIIRRGLVGLSQSLNGRRVAFEILGPGDVVGDVGVFLRMTAPCEGLAIEDTVILTAESVGFHRLLQERPRLAVRWLTAVSYGIVQYETRLIELLAGSLEARLASVLVRRADRGVVKLRQDNLAELVGGRRTSVNRVLKRLEDRQLIRLHYRQVELINEEGLAELAGYPRSGADLWVNARAHPSKRIA